MQVIKMKELPWPIQQVIKSHEGFNLQQVRVEAVVDFTAPRTYCDYNIMRVIGFNMTTGNSKEISSGHYESCMNWTAEEKALYAGNVKAVLTPDVWFIVLDSYPKSRATVYCHPLAIAKAISPPAVELTPAQEHCLYLTRSLMSFARPKGKAWDTAKAELYSLGLMTKGGALTIAGKNIAQNLKGENYNAY
jgi:hypothetical protein